MQYIFSTPLVKVDFIYNTLNYETEILRLFPEFLLRRKYNFSAILPALSRKIILAARYEIQKNSFHQRRTMQKASSVIQGNSQYISINYHLSNQLLDQGDPRDPHPDRVYMH